uniref:Uncharacterized protein n=1 Tax=Anopheles atroparvus TaxID=41427 RepID=A0A182J367_ANOAO
MCLLNVISAKTFRGYRKGYKDYRRELFYLNPASHPDIVGATFGKNRVKMSICSRAVGQDTNLLGE